MSVDAAGMSQIRTTKHAFSVKLISATQRDVIPHVCSVEARSAGDALLLLLDNVNINNIIQLQLYLSHSQL
jgi:hypothetical protein